MGDSAKLENTVSGSLPNSACNTPRTAAREERGASCMQAAIVLTYLLVSAVRLRLGAGEGGARTVLAAGAAAVPSVAQTVPHTHNASQCEDLFASVSTLRTALHLDVDTAVHLNEAQHHVGALLMHRTPVTDTSALGISVHACNANTRGNISNQAIHSTCSFTRMSVEQQCQPSNQATKPRARQTAARQTCCTSYSSVGVYSACISGYAAMPTLTAHPVSAASTAAAAHRSRLPRRCCGSAAAASSVLLLLVC